MTAYSRLHIFTGGEDALGFIDVLPAERVAPLRGPACARPGAPGGAGAERASSTPPCSRRWP